MRKRKPDFAQRVPGMLALAVLAVFVVQSAAMGWSLWANRNRVTLTELLDRPVCGSDLTLRELQARQTGGS